MIDTMNDDNNLNSDNQYELNYLRVLVADLEQRNRQTEELLNVVTEQYRRVTEVVSDYIFSVHIVDGSPVETVHGKGCLPITGYKPEEFADNRFLWLNMVHEEDRPVVLRHVAGILSGKDSGMFEHRIVRKDGAIRWVRNTPVCQYDSEGKLIAYDGLIQDITESRLDNEKLLRNEEKFRIVADFAYDWEEWIAPDGHYLYVSPSCERITGYRPQDFTGNPDLVTHIAHPEDQAKVAAHYNDMTEDHRGIFTFDFRIITKSGEVRWINHNCQAIFKEDGTWLGRRASNRDISKRRRLVDDLAKAGHLEAVGILAGGIAHDFNNILTAVMGNISLARMLMSGTEEKPKILLKAAEEAALRAHALTRQLMEAARATEPVKSPLSLPETLRNIAETEPVAASRLLMHDIPDDISPLAGDPEKLPGALKAVVRNACESMPGNNSLRIAAANVTVTDEDLVSLSNGNYVRIDIGEAGATAVDTPLSETFPPAGEQVSRRGLGLGLVTALSVIRNHGGRVVMKPEEGRGTTFHILLPAAVQQ